MMMSLGERKRARLRVAGRDAHRNRGGSAIVHARTTVVEGDGWLSGAPLLQTGRPEDGSSRP